MPARGVDGALGSPSFMLKSKPTASESTHSNMKVIFSPIWCNFSSYRLQVECLCHLPDIGLRFALKASILSQVEENGFQWPVATFDMTKLRILIGDITQSDADIIVFSAHPSLLAGSGVSGAIHKAAGKKLEAAAKKFAPLKIGEAIITPGFGLKSKYVIHTVCPRHIYGTEEEEDLLRKAYKSSLNLYENTHDAFNIAFVSMGTGIYRWPFEKAARIAIETMLEESKKAITIYLSKPSELHVANKIINEHKKNSNEPI